MPTINIKKYSRSNISNENENSTQNPEEQQPKRGRGRPKKVQIMAENNDDQVEEQQNEKTNNITEEFILYTFLGVFIIFVVDSFARSGKYTR